MMNQKIVKSGRNLRDETADTVAVAHPELYGQFLRPPREYGPSPFWWWTGEPLNRKRLAWQLDQLQSKGVFQAIISYNHLADGTVAAGEPPVFSTRWWRLFRWMVLECKKRGMSLGMQDYCIINPILAQIARDTPDMQGGQLVRTTRIVQSGEQLELTPNAGARALAAFVMAHGPKPAKPLRDISDSIHDGTLVWHCTDGPCTVEFIYVQGHPSNPFDPMHPQAGAKVIERLYQPFEDHCADELGKTIKLCFQDELDFGAHMPLWSVHLPEEFFRRKGYHLQPLLAALWRDIGPQTVKVRLDYADVVAALLEERYFIPIFLWHEQRGILLANDNLGRGSIEEGRRHYADPYRTMRWYSAPGTDDPNLDGPRAFKGLKVNSSIAHLYKRPRVWNECFHSSGWGALPSQMIAALNQDFIYGANVVNLHGLYYSTYGSWWEWAAPDFHFRQPYWQHADALNAWITRMCTLLSAGVHVCDVAIIYPIAAIDGGLNARRRATSQDAGSYSELQRGELPQQMDPAESVAFGLGKYLVDHGIDFDFIDDQSLAGAEIDPQGLLSAGERYRVLILPMMSSIRFASLARAREFFLKGGIVIALGCLPQASDRIGAEDPELRLLLESIFGVSEAGAEPVRNIGDAGGVGIVLPADFSAVVGMINSQIVRDCIPQGAPFQAIHRRVDDHEIYCVFNPSSAAAESEVFFRSTGLPQAWNALDGTKSDVDISRITDDGTRLKVSLEAGESKLIVFTVGGSEIRCIPAPAGVQKEYHTFSDAWEFTALPVMDNRFGDFRITTGGSPEPEIIGVEARQFRYAEETASLLPWHRADFDDSAWSQTTCSYGPRLWVLGPIPPTSDLALAERTILDMNLLSASESVTFSGQQYLWKPYAFSLRWGVENDPFLCSWASGPHGLKGEVPDEFIDLNCDEPGAVWYLATSVQAKKAGTVQFQVGSRSAYAAWLNGRCVLDQKNALPPGIHPAWKLPHYHADPQGSPVDLCQGDNRLILRFEQSLGQRMRAHFAFNPPQSKPALGLRWFTRPNGITLNHRPGEPQHVGWYRFVAAPGLVEMRLVVRGRLRAWVDGEEQVVRVISEKSIEGGRARECLICLSRPVLGASKVALRIDLPPGSFAGDGIPEPVQMRCVKGTAQLGDWCNFGLSSYSGLGHYQQKFVISLPPAGREWMLDLGAVAGTANVRVNGQDAGTLLCPPWRLNISHLVKSGENELAITVANTLANHYSAGIPTPYVYDGQTVSGLLGPVRLLVADVGSRPAAPLHSRHEDES